MPLADTFAVATSWRGRNQRRAHGVVEHAGKEAALNAAVGIVELLTSGVLHAHASGLDFERGIGDDATAHAHMPVAHEALGLSPGGDAARPYELLESHGGAGATVGVLDGSPALASGWLFKISLPIACKRCVLPRPTPP